jgi:protein TonB
MEAYMTTIGYTSRYLLHLDRLKHDERERGAGIPPFMVLIGLALLLHLGVMIPAFFLERSADFVQTKQVSLAFGKKTGELGGTGSASGGAAEQGGGNRASSNEAIASLDSYFAPPKPAPSPTTTLPPRTPQKLSPSSNMVPPPPSSTATAPATPTRHNAGIIPRSTAPTGNGLGMGGIGAGGSGGGVGHGGEGGSNSATRAVISKYEQLLSGWVDRHKIYPPEALQQKMEGRVVVRLRITRKGEVVRTSIQTSSGHRLLDNAVLETVKRASPVPIVPSEYPGGVHLEFLIPVHFSVQ